MSDWVRWFFLSDEPVKQEVLKWTSMICIGLSLYLMIQRKRNEKKEFLNKERQTVQILDIKELSQDTKRFRLSLGSDNMILGLPVGKHLVVYAPNPAHCVSSGTWNGKPDPEKGRQEIERKYTPITGDETPGYVDLVVKIYRPGAVRMPDGRETTWEDGGKGSLFLDERKVGDHIEIRGPVGLNEYLGRGTFKVPGRTVTAKEVGMLAGGTGLTPMLQVVRAALRDPGDACRFTLIYANKTEDDILCRDLLEEAAKTSGGRFRLHLTLDFPPAGWQQKTGFITADMIKECLPGPSDETLVLMCGPPPMVELACKRSLEALGYAKTSMVAF
uniref:FAD-binding FR-type domain-containing protein n=1 Tax=Alexandrium monilatum TaxID=311494 RepID=A0A7S4Q6M6_9DINO|mmetsp:Transcript_17320/g.52181  ORF Transcript_17320/g.52181 Transcript_17320/m.52181 type:complete len:330 (-) Transcript_17320:65-1054(-)